MCSLLSTIKKSPSSTRSPSLTTAWSSSSGVMEGDEIVILNGPLMNQTGLIKKLDRHKRLAYLEIEILGRVKTVKVGLEIVRKKP